MAIPEPKSMMLPMMDTCTAALKRSGLLRMNSSACGMYLSTTRSASSFIVRYGSLTPMML